MPSRTAFGVAAAGVFGAAIRWGVATPLDDKWALLVVNVVGCGIVGWATARRGRIRFRRLTQSSIPSADRVDGNPSPWLTAGFCGALTSMSALALQLARHLDDGRIATAGAWLGLTIAACTAAFVGCRIAVVARWRRS